MASVRKEIAECIIRNEIKDWLQKLVYETSGPDVQIRFQSNDAHISTHTYVEISGSENQIIQVVEVLRDTSELLEYKMPWLNDNTYYVVFHDTQQMIEKQLNIIKQNDSDINYVITSLNINGISLQLFNFRLDLNDKQKMEITKIFKSLNDSYSLFITFPKMRRTKNQSTVYIPKNLLGLFHGAFLNYLNLEDILSLEMANNTNGFCNDENLDHDIQYYIQNHHFNWDFQQFKIKDVLLYSLQKYHERLWKCFIPNILTANEIDSMSRSYNIVFEYHKIIHIDFKPTNKFVDTVDFCAMYHFDPSHTFFLNYEPNYATNHYSVNFRTDDSLDPLACSPKFSNLVVKSQNNFSPQKTNSVLKCVTKHFVPCLNDPQLILNEFNLKHVSHEVLRSLLEMMRCGWLTLEKMDFNLNTLIPFLGQADQNRIILKKCRIEIDELEMDVEINILSGFLNIECLEFRNCRIFRKSWDIPNNTRIADKIVFHHTTFDMLLLLRFLNRLQCTQDLNFSLCDFMPCDHFEEKFCTPNVIQFTNMSFKSQTLFQFFENCEIQNGVIFQNCHMNFENYVPYEFPLQKIATIEFHHMKFDQFTLFRILEMLNNESKVSLVDCCVLPADGNAVISNKFIRLNFIRFINCTLETQTLVNILAKLAEKTEILFNSCELLQSVQVYENHILTNQLTEVYLKNMELSSKDLFTILLILKLNSRIVFRKCKITAISEEVVKLNLPLEITIQFSDMTIETLVAQSILQTDATIIFSHSRLKFMADEFFNMPIRSRVIFRRMTLDLSTHLKSLANFTPTSRIQFQNCHFKITKSVIFNIVIKLTSIRFNRTTLDLEALITIIERCSEKTNVIFHECDIQSNTRIFSKLPIKIPTLCFKKMNLEIEIISWILKNFSGQSILQIADKCKILCSNPNELSITKLPLMFVSFDDMDIDVQIFQTIVQMCPSGMTVSFNCCRILPVRNNIVTNVTVNIGDVIFTNVDYSPELLQLLHCLNDQCTVSYLGQLSSQAILAICTQTRVHGKRLQLFTQICTKTICFDLFAEFFRLQALNFQLDTETEYDLPTHLIPFFSSILFENRHDWKVYKIKVLSVNDECVKLEFLKNGKPIDLFFELNDLPDDSDECVVDYY